MTQPEKTISKVKLGSMAAGALAVGALACGAMGIGVLANGALTVRRLNLGSPHREKVSIGTLTVDQLNEHSD